MLQTHRAAYLIAGVMFIAAPLTQAQETAADAGTAGGGEETRFPGEFGGGRVKTHVSGLAFYTDNFYNQQGSSSAEGLLVAPGLDFLTRSSKIEFGGLVDADYGTFNTPGGQDNYLDWRARLNLSGRTSVRSLFRLDGSAQSGHDPFGVDRTEDVTARGIELDEWRRNQAGLHYRFGAPGATFNAEVGTGTIQKHYTTNTGATEPLNYRANTGDYTVFYNYSPKTAALINFERTGISFDRGFIAPGAVTRDGTLYRLRGGVHWLATGKTAGDVRVGYHRRLFDDGSTPINGLDWEAGVDWAPIPRTQVRFESAYQEQESYRSDARVIQLRSLSVDWKYSIDAKTRTDVRVERITAGFDASTRDDTIQSLTFGAERLMLSYLWLVGNAALIQRDSSVATREYDRMNLFVGVRLGR